MIFWYFCEPLPQTLVSSITFLYHQRTFFLRTNVYSMHYSHYSLVLFVAHEINKIDENRTEPQHNNIAATTHQHIISSENKRKSSSHPLPYITTRTFTVFIVTLSFQVHNTHTHTHTHTHTPSSFNQTESKVFFKFTQSIDLKRLK